MKKRILSIAIVLLFVLSLCSCSGNSKPKNGTYATESASIVINNGNISFYINDILIAEAQNYICTFKSNIIQ